VLRFGVDGLVLRFGVDGLVLMFGVDVLVLRFGVDVLVLRFGVVLLMRYTIKICTSGVHKDSETCLNRTTFGQAFVLSLRIDRCSIYTNQINKDFLY
jgi:hypothetical protein